MSAQSSIEYRKRQPGVAGGITCEIRVPLRVCFLITDFSDGGAQRQCIYLLNELQCRTDLDLHLIYLHSGVHEHLLSRANVQVTKLSVTSNYDPRNLLQLRNALRRIRPDILFSWLHACDVYSFFVRRCVPGMRWIFAERGSRYPRDPRYFLRRELGRHADAIIANSAAGGAYWREAGARGPCFVVPNIVRIPGETQGIPRTRSVIFVGRLEPQKNAVILVRAFCALAARRQDLSFLVIGDGSLRGEAEGVVVEAGLAGRIAFLGFQRDPFSLIASAATVVSISHFEGLPNVLLESVALGTTVVASDIPEHRELLGPDYPFYVADRDSAEACATVIERALTPGGQPGALCFARARTAEMTPRVIGDRYLDIFQRIKAGRQ